VCVCVTGILLLLGKNTTLPKEPILKLLCVHQDEYHPFLQKDRYRVSVDREVLYNLQGVQGLLSHCGFTRTAGAVDLRRMLHLNSARVLLRRTYFFFCRRACGDAIRAPGAVVFYFFLFPVKPLAEPRSWGVSSKASCRTSILGRQHFLPLLSSHVLPKENSG
jgi:hypothetical protein